MDLACTKTMMDTPAAESAWVAVTIASKRYLPLARVTADSFCEHNPGVPFYLLLADEPRGLKEEDLAPFHILRLEQMGISELDRFRFQHTELELSYAATPFVIDHLLSAGFRRVLFLKQETLVLDDLAPVVAPLANHSAVLTPHLLEPLNRPDGLEWEINVLRSGVFNGGVVGFADSPEARAFLLWWQAKTAAGCFIDMRNGMHYEQRWLDFAPSLMPHCHILRDPGVNVGHWNLPERRVRVHEGRVTADGMPCRVFRFSGYRYDQPEMVTRYNQTLAVANTGDAAGVFGRYRALLEAAGFRAAQQHSYAYHAFDNGVPIPLKARRLYHSLGVEARRFGNPFAAEPSDSYYRWLPTQPERNGQ